MAFAARLGTLTEELISVTAATSSQSDPGRFKALKESSLHSLRHHNFLRTNQFDVDNHLDGIEERFRVLNRDGLADALRERLDALLKVSNKFSPETLHFLLELSEQPVQKSRLEDLDFLRGPDNDPGPQLKWEDIAKEDDWADDRELWKKVDFEDNSSDEEHVNDPSDASVKSEETSLSSIEAQYRGRPTDLIVESQGDNALKQVYDRQSWRSHSSNDAKKKPETVAVSEVQAVREVLFMLSGLENDLFSSHCEPSPKYRLQHASWESFRALSNSFSQVGRNLSILRNFTKKPQQVPLLQVFRDAVEKGLRNFNAEVAAVERRFVDIKKDTVVSLLQVLEDIKPHSQRLASLSDVVRQLEREKYPHPFRYLELLFNSAGIAQLEGDDQIYDFLGTVFFECFQVYLRPIRLWMKDGELLDGDRTFFISDSKSHLHLSQVWQSQFKLRKTPDGVLHAPSFLQPAVSKIFTTGKSVVILKHLGKHNTLEDHIAEPSLDFQTLSARGSGSFAPFSEVFNAGFESWMQSKHHAASATLRRALFESCNLWSILSNLQHVYLMVDGSRADAFAHALFNNLDLLNPRWHDRFLLTQVCHDAFGMDSHRITVVAVEEQVHDDIVTARKSVRKCLPAVRVRYRMPWPVRIILSEESIAHYQAIFTLLLQNRRATYVLQKHRLGSEGTSNISDEQATYYGLRSKLLWFCNSLQTYLSGLVLAPLIDQVKGDLLLAEDVDSMISTHSTFAKHILDAACLGSKLDPIRECMLDIMDLAIRLEDARSLEAKHEAEETQELSRLSLSTPMNVSQLGRSGKYVEISEEEDESFLSEQGKSAPALGMDKSYAEILAEIRAQLDRHLGFICGGLRGVARASGNAAAGKWDTLAEMLEAGIQENTW
ncbi:Spc97/Spc98 family protein [Xylariales sp. AK1849]|nr:Spc97/Spc98 family protein [Xylariales sp. AK1849]